MSFYRFAKNFVWYLLKPFYRMEVHGRENIPEAGPVIICSNHISNFDPPVVGGAATRDLHFLAKAELFKGKFFNYFFRKLNAVPIKRGTNDRQALREALALLKEGKVLGLFPEGTRSKSGELGEGLSGIGFFALRSDAIVVPCVIIGPYKIGRKLKIVFGSPVEMASLRESKASAKEATEKIMTEISNLQKKQGQILS